MVTPWSARTRSGNPADAAEVRAYVEEVRNQQVKAGTTPQQAVVMKEASLKSMIVQMNNEAPGSSKLGRLLILRDQALLLSEYHTSTRSSQLGETKFEGILRLPGNRGFIFDYVWGKTLRTGQHYAFGVPRRPENWLLCPVRALDRYVGAMRAAGWLTRGFVFRRLNEEATEPRSQQGSKPLANKQVNAIIEARLNACGLFQGETSHGVRAAAAVNKALDDGYTHDDVMHASFWKDEGTAMRYLQTLEVLGADTEGATMDQYAFMNELPITHPQ